MSIMLKRKIELDYVKGFAILAMLFSHCMATENVILSWITSFHMAVFFVVSGILKAEKELSSLTLKEVGQYLKKRSFQLLVPYFIFGVLLIFFFQALALISGEELTIVSQLLDLCTFYGIESLWFIPIFFFSEFIFNFIYIRLPKWIRVSILVITVIALSILLHFFEPTEVKVLRFLIKIVISLSFMYIGYIIGRCDLVQKCNILVAIVMLISASIATYFNGPVGISAIQLGNVCLFYLNAVLISFALLVIFKKISEHWFKYFKWLEFFGKNTIVILCTNNIFIETIRLLDSKLFDSILIEWGMFGNVVFAVIMILIEALVIYISKGKIGILFGQKR